MSGHFALSPDRTARAAALMARVGDQTTTKTTKTTTV